MKFKESNTVELKEIINNDFKKEIIAFANTDGGEIYVGINKYGEIVGINDTDTEMQKIGNMIRNGIKPDLTNYTTIEEISIDGKSIIKVTVLTGQKRPYHLSDKGLKPSGVFVRHGVSSVPATEDAIRTMLKETDGTTFDKSRCINQELSFDYAKKYFDKEKLSFKENNMRTLGLIDSDGYYTNAAMLLSDQCEHSIRCAIYADTTKLTFKARKEFNGSILKQLDEAYEYVNLSNNQNSTFEGLLRVEHPDYPEDAIREALLNAVVHRDYDYSGSILINIFTDRIEFVSIGGLVKGITLKDIMAGVSQPRNTVIAAIFYRLHLIESYGTGIQRILENYSNQPLQPMFNPAPSSFVVVLPKLSNNNKELSDEEKILEHIKTHGSISRQEAEVIINNTKYPTLNRLNAMIKDNQIVKKGSARNTRYELKSTK
ncbi:MAG: putative DNA binding domain-containing protein [Clostridiales bacterium]|nr:putative DNA binding domain-containing protein [Clostridiales bacterium]